MIKWICWLFKHPTKTDVTYAGRDRVGHVYCRCGEVNAWWRTFDYARFEKRTEP